MRIEEEIKQKKFKNEYHKLTVNLIFTGKWLENKSNQLLKPFGLSMQQFNLMRILRGQHPKPATVNLLIDRMMDKSSNASRLVEKLRAKGLVERHACEQDRRAVDVILTEKGLELLQNIDAKMMHGQDEPITADEANQLNLLLDKFRG